MNGFEYKNNLLTISKDKEAVLKYTFEWNEWLVDTDEIVEYEYLIQNRANDPRPLVNEGDGLAGSKTYITLSGGQQDKTYIVSVKVTTSAGLVERRNFRVNVINRTA